MDITNILEGIGSIGVFLGAAYIWINKQIEKWKPVIGPLILEAEQMGISDGKIDSAEKKKLVMDGIKSAEEKGLIKLNFITRFIISRVVDKIAKALPDIIINKPS